MKNKGEDNVNHPKHYTQNNIECIEAIESATGDGFEAYLQGSIIKYLWRYKFKNGSEDLEKAEFYLKMLIRKTKKTEMDYEDNFFSR
jgi:hypothetical protein|tara:strand:+ start:617 stop:877 length:261 start_codon:yes stop_codon:yes gene_type:complete